MTGKGMLLKRAWGQGLAGGDVGRGRLAGGGVGRGGLAGGGFSTPGSLVGWMGCIQAQDFGQAKWAIGVRRAAATEEEVDAAFNEGRILRTHVLRPTWHFVLPADIRWMLRLTAPRIRQFCRPYHAKMGIDAAVLGRSRKVMEKALSDGGALTRLEIAALLRRAKIDTSDIRMGFLLMDAELEELICSGPRKGKEFTYALLEGRARAAGDLGPEEAEGELAARYFRSRGPATLADFAWWSGLTLGQAKRGLDAVKGGLERDVVDGGEYWFVPGAEGGGGVLRAPRVLLLPAFDEYTVAYKDRAHVLPREYEKGSSYGLKPVVVVDGRVAGVWRREVRKGGVAVEVSLFGKAGKTVQAAIGRGARRYAEFAGGALVLFSSGEDLRRRGKRGA